MLNEWVYLIDRQDIVKLKTYMVEQKYANFITSVEWIKINGYRFWNCVIPQYPLSGLDMGHSAPQTTSKQSQIFVAKCNL